MSEQIALAALEPLPQLRMVLQLPGPMPGLNEIINAKGASARVHDARGRLPNDYTKLKKRWAALIKTIAQVDRVQPVGPSAWTYVWCEADKRRDPSNITSGGRKLIEDALKEAGLIEGDGWRHVLDIRDHWLVAPQRLGVCVIAAAEVLEREQALRVMASRAPSYQQLHTPQVGRRRR